MRILSNEVLLDDALDQLLRLVRSEAPRLREGWVAAVDFRDVTIASESFADRLREFERVLGEAGAGPIGLLLRKQVAVTYLLPELSGGAHREEHHARRFFDPVRWETFIRSSGGSQG